MSASFRVLCAAAAFSLGSLAAVSAQAGCTLNDEAGAVRRSLNSLSRCNDRRFRRGTEVTCKLQPAPACAGTLVADSLALGYGANNPPSSAVDKSMLADQLKCQKHVGRAIVGYVGRKLASLIKGQDTATARLELELYDLVADPYEENNVATVPANAARVAAMAARLRELRPNWPVDSLPNGDDPEE